ncbi:MAG TPA: TonB-dependent receptor, partial [Rhodothermales bacterium]|nr:TonB-dependent receptor [Rhodothermales bacterium]
MGNPLRHLAHFFIPCVIVLGTCVAAASPALAGGLTGKVTDERGQPLPGATVTLRDAASGQQRYGTVTGEDGTFQIRTVQPGRYDLLVSYVGFSAYRRALVMGREDQRVQVRLSPFTVEQPDVIMTATRARAQLTPITFSNLTARELQNLADMKDLPVLLSTLPSVTYHSENGNGIGYSTLRMRGFDQHRVAVSINGIPQNDPEDFDVYWINFFDIQGAIQDIQVQRGAGASFYGPDAIGGAINIVA